MIRIRSELALRLNRLPRVKHILKVLRDTIFFKNNSVVSSYVSLHKAEATEESRRLRSAWQDGNLPMMQRNLVEQQLQQYKAGKPVLVFDIFIKALKILPDCESKTLLEIGCSSGHYSEVLETARLPITYSGCDYSSSFIDLANKKYPDISFSVEDAVSLNYLDKTFDIVVSGCCLLHIPEYLAAIKEACRVSRRYVIFHRTPVVWGVPEQWYRKEVYGIETVEIHFNEDELLTHFRDCGLDVLSALTLSEEAYFKSPAGGKAVRTYVCIKRIKPVISP